ncbi:MAG: hydroxymethylglutaryl-CoA lyase [Methyloversatilis sp. 12-65-5]|nr:MAG: hydroxymethylglutaryl-CoA lyase [Methyloversatilis sp. 12-65-5]
MAALPAAVRIVEVGPRDGLQNETVGLDVERRLELIARLAQTGLRDIEAGAFVSPRRVPNMAGSGELMRRLDRQHGVSYPCLVPNETGLDAALDAGCSDIAIFAAVSETFSQRNTGCSIAESMGRLARVAVRAHDAGLRVRGYLSCVMGCPYEGAVSDDMVATLTAELLAMGCHEVSLGDTTGVGSPFRVRTLIDRVARRAPPQRLAGHFHDTWGMATANAYAAALAGVTVFDASVGGLGGCPFAPGATGNVATEDLVYLFDDAGVHTGIDFQKVVEVAYWISAQLDRPVASRVARAFNSRRPT